ncbi:MAG: metal ABC transporter ATP-binding protein, partial [Anaerolineales bacterium]|nr:metal ABC transporter ATP-binding protein [Anaerolineales bacterium]
YETGLALDDVTFRLQAGERVAVVGPNGAGKSTLFKVIAGVSALTSGEVRVAGYKPGGHICIAYLPQRSQVNWNFPVSVADVVMMGRVGRLGALHWPSGQDWSFVRTCLEAVGLERLSDRQISELSGGQQQRMFIARGLAQEAELLLMDEPLNGLDVTSQQIIFQVLDELRSKGVTVMIATHDLEQAGEYFDRVMLLNRRLIGFGLPGEVFSASRLMEAYGSHLRIVKAEEGFVALGDSCCEDGEGG